jgi:arylsulfatase
MKILLSITCALALSLPAMAATKADATKNAAPVATLDRNAADGSVLPYPPAPFGGQTSLSPTQSKAQFPAQVKAPNGAPNVIVVLTDDVGFAASSTFGGSIPTPSLDQLAAHGLRFNHFHTTAMCSPTRAALLTGRNHHAVANGTVADMSTGYPGYNGEIPRSAATIAEILRLNGYSTAMFGKHHNAPYEQLSAAGPFDLWPTGLGFEYFYGFLGGDTDQWQPKLYRGTSPLDTQAEMKGQLLDKVLADEAINWVHNQKAGAPDKPFFMYYATGSAHAPHQAPKEWIDRFKGKFDMGWDKLREQNFAQQKAQGVIPANAVLTPRPAAIPAWDSISPEQQRVNARQMEVYAAQLAYQDAQFGRIIDELKRMGQLDNTLVMFVEGDNGASGEGGINGSQNELGAMANRMQQPTEWMTKFMPQMGGPKSYQLYAVGWAWAIDTPFQWTKQIASHLGGTRNGFVVSWPARIKAQGEQRTQFHHVIDIMPTVLEAAGVKAPSVVYGVEQQRVDGVSMAYAFDDAKAADRRTTQYFEMLGNRSIYHDGWLASTTPPRGPWMDEGKSLEPDAYQWELYNLNEDFSQANNLAAAQPEKLKEMQQLWMQEAERNNVLPVDTRNGMLRAMSGRPFPSAKTFTYWGRDISVPQKSGPMFAGRSFSITADVVLPAKANGVLVATGSWFGGWSFYLDKGRVVAHEAASQKEDDQFRVQSNAALPAGPAKIRFDFASDGGIGAGGTMSISVDGKQVASGRFGRTILVTAGLGETFDIGIDTGVPVVEAYKNSGRLEGEIEKVVVEFK